MKFSLRKVGISLFLVTFLSIHLDSWVSTKMQEALGDPNGATQWVWFFALLSIGISIVTPSVSIALVGASIKAMRSARPQKLNWVDLNQIIIETLRSWGKSFLWSLLFIVPGFVKLLRLSLVPWVVLFDPRYAEGGVDALAESEKLSKGLMLKLFGVFFLFSVLIPLLLTSFDEYKVFWNSPLVSVLLAGLETLLTLVFLLWLFDIFERKTKGIV